MLKKTVVSLTLLTACATGWCAPESDAFSRFLSDRGLVENNNAKPVRRPAAIAANKPSFMGQMRDKASDMVVMAMNFLDVPYRWGGNNAQEGFDCSGFTKFVFQKGLGLALPRRAQEQANDPELRVIEKKDLQPGDASTLFHKRYEAAVGICRALDYHFESSTGSHGGLCILWPLRMAAKVLKNGTRQEKRWLERRTEQAMHGKGMWDIRHEIFREYQAT